MIPEEDFIDWKANPTTKFVMSAIANYIEMGKEELSYKAGSDPLADRETVGKLAAFREILDLKYHDLEDNE